jgi:pimeloyl-ACP methyl ester carboxylesterase
MLDPDPTCSVTVERTFTSFEGADIEFLAWGPRNSPGILLIHGFGASAEWWVAVGGLLAPWWRVVAFSCSGHGRSAWRDVYDIDLYKREALACAKAGGALDAGPVAVVAHSFGAIAGARLAAGNPAEVRAFLVLDRAIVQNKRAHVPPEGAAQEKRFATRQIAIEKFRLRPPATFVDRRLLHEVANSAIQEIGDGDRDSYWTWRMDPAIRRKLAERQPSIAPELAAMRCSRGFVRGTNSTLFLPHEADEIRSIGIPVISVPAAGHHLMLEQPVATACAIDTFLRVLVPSAIGKSRNLASANAVSGWISHT